MITPWSSKIAGIHHSYGCEKPGPCFQPCASADQPAGVYCEQLGLTNNSSPGACNQQLQNKNNNKTCTYIVTNSNT